MVHHPRPTPPIPSVLLYFLYLLFSLALTLSLYTNPVAMSDPGASPGRTTTTITATTHLTLPSHPTPLTYDQLNPKSHADEFLGPVGTASISLIAPFLVYAFFYSCNESTGCPPMNSAGWRAIWDRGVGTVWEWQAGGAYLVWYAFCVACWALLPGERVEGSLLRDGKRNTYRMNGASSPPAPLTTSLVRTFICPSGFYTLLLSLGISVGILMQPGGIELFTWLYDHWIPLVSASLAMATFQAFFFYLNSFRSGELLALGGNSGVFVYDVSPTYSQPSSLTFLANSRC